MVRPNHQLSIGVKFNRLLVKDIVKEGKYTRYICECDCGKIAIPYSFSVLNNKVKSCGCFHAENSANRAKTLYVNRPKKPCKPYGVSSFNRLFWIYKRNAKKRNYQFDLTSEQFKTITKQNCYFCGIEPIHEGWTRRNKSTPYIHNGIDRLDNTKGYTIDNCVPCCKQCNVAKGIMTEIEFDNWVKRIFSHRNTKE